MMMTLWLLDNILMKTFCAVATPTLYLDILFYTGIPLNYTSTLLAYVFALWDLFPFSAFTNGI